MNPIILIAIMIAILFLILKVTGKLFKIVLIVVFVIFAANLYAHYFMA